MRQHTIRHPGNGATSGHASSGFKLRLCDVAGSGANRARTGDLRAASATLSQLSYSPEASKYIEAGGALAPDQTARGSSGLTGWTAIPRGSASRSSTIAVSATATSDRCWSRASKSAMISRSAAR